MQRKLATLALLASLCAGNAHAETVHVTQINAREFRGNSAGAHVFAPNSILQMQCFPDSNDSFASRQIRLPDGSQLQNLRLYANDSGAEDLRLSLLKSCQPSFAGGPITTTNLLTLTTSGTPGNTQVSGGVPTLPVVDNEQCVYILQARFGNTGTSCDPNLQLQRVRLQWAN